MNWFSFPFLKQEFSKLFECLSTRWRVALMKHGSTDRNLLTQLQEVKEQQQQEEEEQRQRMCLLMFSYLPEKLQQKVLLCESVCGVVVLQWPVGRVSVLGLKVTGLILPWKRSLMGALLGCPACVGCVGSWFWKEPKIDSLTLDSKNVLTFLGHSDWLLPLCHHLQCVGVCWQCGFWIFNSFLSFFIYSHPQCYISTVRSNGSVFFDWIGSFLLP